jgi:UDP-N-acetylglucosamine acyltransferase
MPRPASSQIHPTAIISDEADLAADVQIGPFAVIEGPVTIGPGCVLYPHVHLIGPLSIGANNQIWSGCVLGGPPQHLGYKGEATLLEIGDNNIFREYVTVHRGMPTGSGRGTTRIGNKNLFMAGSHVAHDCTVGNENLFANYAVIGGHVEVADRVLLSGNSAVHQFCRVGRLALLSGSSATSKDIPPFWVMQEVNQVGGVNIIGMKRAGIPTPEIQAVRRAFRLIYVERLAISAAIDKIERDMGHFPAIRELATFIRTSKRGICGTYRLDERSEAA